MSVTATDAPTTAQLGQILQDYEICLTGTENGIPAASPATTATSIEKPVDWPEDFRRVPPHRPINRDLDREQRPDGTNPIERAFIFVMLHGVWLNATVAQAWRKTGGRINSDIFRYKIGGEW